MKSDNGSAFIADEVERFLEARGVYHLLSPPRLPSYNGACEAGIGSLKTRAHHESARNDRPGECTCDDGEAARLMANETTRPGGFHAPTPNERWRIRLLLSQGQHLEVDILLRTLRAGAHRGVAQKGRRAKEFLSSSPRCSAGKSFEVQVGPDQPHSGVNQQRIMEFFIENLVMHPERLIAPEKMKRTSICEVTL